MPLYESIGGTVTAIAIVENPAVEINSIVAADTKVLYGIVMQPNLKIFRDTGRSGTENCYWFFSEHTIKTLQQNFKGEINLATTKSNNFNGILFK